MDDLASGDGAGRSIILEGAVHCPPKDESGQFWLGTRSNLISGAQRARFVDAGHREEAEGAGVQLKKFRWDSQRGVYAILFSQILSARFGML